MWIPWAHLPSPLPPMHPWQWLAMRRTRFTVQPCAATSQSCHPLGATHTAAKLGGEPPEVPQSFQESLSNKEQAFPGDKLPGPRGSLQCLPRDKSRLLGLYWFLSLRWYHKDEQGRGLSARPRCRTSNRRCGGSWLTRPAGRSQLQHIPASLLPSLRSVLVICSLIFFFALAFGALFSPPQRWWWAWGAQDSLALHCYMPAAQGARR